MDLKSTRETTSKNPPQKNPKIDTTYEYEIKVTLYNMVSDYLCIRFCVFGFWFILLAGR